MAKIKLSGLVSDVAGKLNGSVFQRSKSGLSLRTNPKKKVELSARQRQTFSINTKYRKLATPQAANAVKQFEKESMRHPMHSRFQSSYYIPAGAYLGKRFVEALAYGAIGTLAQPDGLSPFVVIENTKPTYNAATRILTLDYTPEFPYAQASVLVVDLQLSRSYTGSWSPDRWKHLGWYAPTPPQQQLLVQAFFLPDYAIKYKRMYCRIRVLFPIIGLWSNSIISEVIKV